jgi:hypothetical protein
MSKGRSNNLQSLFGTFFLYHNMFRCATFRQTGQTRKWGIGAYANPEIDREDSNDTQEACGCRQLHAG